MEIVRHPMTAEGSVCLSPSPWKWAGVGLVSLAFTVGGAWMIRSGDRMGWLCLAFFGLGVLVSILCVLPNASYLELDRDGFTVCAMFRAGTYAWSDVTEFGVGCVFTTKMVMFNFEPTHTRTAGAVRALNAGLTGYEAGIPDTYGLKHEELAELMNKYRRAARGG